jgi:hypothetical protein
MEVWIVVAEPFGDFQEDTFELPVASDIRDRPRRQRREFVVEARERFRQERQRIAVESVPGAQSNSKRGADWSLPTRPAAMSALK